MRRRTFLVGSVAAVGGLALGYRAWTNAFEAQAAQLVARNGETLLGGWVKIGTDDTVTVYVPHVDMGQGTHTALAMMLAEELDADWSHVSAERAPGEKAFANRFLAEGWILQGWRLPVFLDGAIDMGFGEVARFINLQITGGSTAVRFTGQVGMRIVGAAARAMLIEAAARRWGVSAQELVAAHSIVTHAPSGRSQRYGDLAADAARLSVPASPPLKPRKDYKIIGRSVPRFDIPAKVTGALQYGIDVQLPGMLAATVKAAPVHGGKLASVDPTPAMRIKGVERVIALENAVAVVARGYWQASRGLAALEPVFTDGGNGTMSSQSQAAQQDQILGAGGSSRHKAGDADAALKAAPADRVIEASYRVPFLHHAAMEPINATAQFKDGRLTVWGGEQDALGSKAYLAKVSGLSAANVSLIALPVGGSFGRRIALTAQHLHQVADIARHTAPQPVKMIWSREEDFAQGAYRPAVASRISAALGPNGMPTAWSQVFIDIPGPGLNDGFLIPYAIPNQSIRSVTSATHVRTGTWRSVAHSQHGFWSESFIDELAAAAGRDPFEYRRELLAPASRHRRVLEAAAEKAGWGTPLPAGVGRGIALVESFGTIVAHVVEASLGRRGVPSVHRVTAAVDCGDVCHPDTASAQIEGAIVMGLSAAIAEEITVERGAIVQKTFSDYPLLTLASTPPHIEVHFLRSEGPWGGLGEPGLPPVAPALANALFAATGRRMRTLPLIAAAHRAAG
ncbi:MAG: molybdopterin-dependent oxidoreductase [Hyphomonadaceae bacterium]|nr:molybdopterin-dependent oxidoreductase [Hyphomonadaceae bacterium]